MGRTTSLDGALQLLLIIDLICEWARDVFRFEISCCLAGGIQNLRENNLRSASPTPTYGSRFSSHEPQLERTTNSSVHGGVRSSPIPETNMDTVDFAETASVASLTLQNSMMELDRPTEDYYPTVAQDESTETYSDTVSHPHLTWAKLSADAPWAARAAIRHSNTCLFVFSHLSLPEDLDSLSSCLQQASSVGIGSTRAIAKSLVVSLTDHALVKNTTIDWILQLKNYWLWETVYASIGSKNLLRALFAFRSYIRTSDWQVVRELWCISCTAQTLHNLATIAGLNMDGVLRSRIWQREKESLLPVSDFEALRRLTGSGAASAAISSKVLYHCLPSRDGGEAGSFGFPWEARMGSDRLKRSFSLLAPSVCCHGRIAQCTNKGTALIEVLKKPSPKGIWRLLGPEIPAKRGAILLQKGQHWPLTTPSWCLMILDETEPKRGQELALRLLTQEYYQAFDFAPRHDETGKPCQTALAQTGDDEFLNAWLEDLRS
jgi:hypothetical protein